MARNDFLTGVLQGLYQGGVGNPQANAASKQAALEQAYKQGELNLAASKEGMVPDIHPHTNNVIDNVMGAIFPGSSGPSLNTTFKADPNQGTYGINSEGSFAQGTQAHPLDPQYLPVSRDKGIAGLAAQGKAPQPDASLVFDQKTQRPRIEPLDYVAKPGEMVRKSNLKEALSSTGQFASNESRGGYYGARESQIGSQMRDEFSKSIDPSTLSPTSVIGRAAQSIKRVVSGETLLKEGEVVNQARLQAAKADIDVIVTNASATVEGQKMLNTPTFKSKIQELSSYLSSDPGEVPVPKGVVDIYRKIITDLGPISENTVQKYIDNQYKFKKGAYRSTLSPGEMDSYTQSVKDQYDIKKLLKNVDGSSSSIPTITSDADFNKLASGAEFIDGTGQKHRKK